MFSTCARCGSRSRIAAVSTSPPHAKTVRSEDLNRRRQLVNLAVALLAMCPVALQALCRWMKRKPVRDMAGLDRVQRRVGDLLGYLERNQAALVPYAARRRRGEPISTAFVESAVNEIVAKRMTKAQQMRWNRATVQPFLDV